VRADIWILRDLSLGQADINKVGDLVAQHTAALKHAFCCASQRLLLVNKSVTQLEHRALRSCCILTGLDYCNSLYTSYIYSVNSTSTAENTTCSCQAPPRDSTRSSSLEPTIQCQLLVSSLATVTKSYVY